ncbi:hypothetical protein SKAU_G00089340 [Synaphobranchus kaupii]|uniref:Uncharacterized protein n=1 Tax=Synaphobranchus kaupii TaxID=118154 RepID=A0A9Q1FWD1_SYNKA|nr:hypothetical protein SKAU_G00089340 [Synaphobranchus kaupii]
MCRKRSSAPRASAARPAPPGSVISACKGPALQRRERDLSPRPAVHLVLPPHRRAEGGGGSEGRKKSTFRSWLRDLAKPSVKSRTDAQRLEVEAGGTRRESRAENPGRRRRTGPRRCDRVEALSPRDGAFRGACMRANGSRAQERRKGVALKGARLRRAPPSFCLGKWRSP